MTAPEKPPAGPWHVGVITLLVGPILGAAAAYFYGLKWLAQSQHPVKPPERAYWITWAISSAAWLVLVELFFR